MIEAQGVAHLPGPRHAVLDVLRKSARVTTAPGAGAGRWRGAYPLICASRQRSATDIQTYRILYLRYAFRQPFVVAGLVTPPALLAGSSDHRERSHTVRPVIDEVAAEPMSGACAGHRPIRFEMIRAGEIHDRVVSPHERGLPYGL